jgi:hypothetical protein
VGETMTVDLTFFPRIAATMIFSISIRLNSPTE